MFSKQVSFKEEKTKLGIRQACFVLHLSVLHWKGSKAKYFWKWSTRRRKQLSSTWMEHTCRHTHGPTWLQVCEASYDTLLLTAFHTQALTKATQTHTLPLLMPHSSAAERPRQSAGSPVSRGAWRRSRSCGTKTSRRQAASSQPSCAATPSPSTPLSLSPRHCTDAWIDRCGAPSAFWCPSTLPVVCGDRMVCCQGKTAVMSLPGLPSNSRRIDESWRWWREGQDGGLCLSVCLEWGCGGCCRFINKVTRLYQSSSFFIVLLPPAFLLCQFRMYCSCVLPFFDSSSYLCSSVSSL